MLMERNDWLKKYNAARVEYLKYNEQVVVLKKSIERLERETKGKRLFTSLAPGTFFVSNYPEAPSGFRMSAVRLKIDDNTYVTVEDDRGVYLKDQYHCTITDHNGNILEE